MFTYKNIDGVTIMYKKRFNGEILKGWRKNINGSEYGRLVSDKRQVDDVLINELLKEAKEFVC